MSDSEAVGSGPSDSIPREGEQPRGKWGGCPAGCVCAGIVETMQRLCPTSADVTESTERVRGTIRAQPLMAVLAAVGVGLLLGRLSSSRGQGGRAER